MSSESEEVWNPRFVAYAQVNGNTPARQLQLDTERWPGGCMTGFIGFIHKWLPVWRQELRDLGVDYWESAPHADNTISGHEAFDRWLSKRPRPITTPEEEKALAEEKAQAARRGQAARWV